MSDTTLDGQPDAPSLLLDDDAPRLSSAPLHAPTPTAGAPAPATPPGEAPSAPSLPVVSPVLASAEATMQPESPATPAPAPPVEAPPTPTLPDVAPVLASAATTMHADSSDGDQDEDAKVDADGEPVHPMAHLMPAKSRPSEAQRRAAEQRAVKKAKARKIKIGVAAGFLVVSAVVGPPLFSWLTDAINEAGGIENDETDG